MGDEIIPFTLESQVGTLNFRDLIDSKWGMLITFDKAFEPVATTELVYNIIIYIIIIIIIIIIITIIIGYDSKIIIRI
jgi:hypothetical protein